MGESEDLAPGYHCDSAVLVESQLLVVMEFSLRGGLDGSSDHRPVKIAASCNDSGVRRVDGHIGEEA